jgi:hypothetical protein
MSGGHIKGQPDYYVRLTPPSWIDWPITRYPRGSS